MKEKFNSEYIGTFEFRLSSDPSREKFVFCLTEKRVSTLLKLKSKIMEQNNDFIVSLHIREVVLNDYENVV